MNHKDSSYIYDGISRIFLVRLEMEDGGICPLCTHKIERVIRFKTETFYCPQCEKFLRRRERKIKFLPYPKKQTKKPKETTKPKKQVDSKPNFEDLYYETVSNLNKEHHRSIRFQRRGNRYLLWSIFAFTALLAHLIAVHCN